MRGGRRQGHIKYMAAAAMRAIGALGFTSDII